ncbi:MAG: PhzF family phenazine biosynthesis protein [Povalibacter sp.]
MRTPIYKLDAFASRRFTGNPAAVLPLESFPDDTTMQAIAAENNLAETAFIVRADPDYRIRWFTPTVEVPFCGHATLAAAAVIMERLEPKRERVVFHSASGALIVERRDSNYVMNFPARRVERADGTELTAILGAQPLEVHSDNLNNYVVLFENAATVRKMNPNLTAIAQLKRTGVIVTAPGDEGYDFVSRYFAPGKGIPEDPVTGGAHCALTPFWAARLGRSEFHAYQASRRGGEVRCRLLGDRVELQGSVVFYLEGEVEF